MSSLDRLDAQLLSALEADPRTGAVELAERLGTSRNTVQARLLRLRESGVLRGFRVDVDPELVGVPVSALVSVDLSQGSLADVLEGLVALPQVLEVLTCTGEADLVVRVAARSNAELQDLIQELLLLPGVVRTTTQIVLTTPVPWRVQPLLDHLTEGAGRGRARRG
jgi:DNA-binding Lrp family transcriptional regulator